MNLVHRIPSKPLLAFFAPLLIIAVALPCVPCGGSSPVTLPRPSLPPAPAGAPGGSSWASDRPKAEEHDDASSNEPMGNATPDSTSNSATVNVDNNSGNLSGPNGDVVNGGGEGDCIEVAICWYYWTWIKEYDYYMTDTGFEITYTWVHVKKKVCNGGNDVEVCPCKPCP